MITKMDPIKFHTVILSLVSLTIVAKAQDPSYLYHFCSGATHAYAENSPFKANLILLLSSLASNGNRNNIRFINGFYNSSAGQVPDDVRGLFLCRGDVNNSVCQNCVSFGTKDIVQRCPLQKGAVVWYDECMVRYTYFMMFSVLNEEPWQAWRRLASDNNVSVEPDRFEQIKASIRDTATRAANAPLGAKKIAVKEMKFSGFPNVYILVQCTPDLSSVDCDWCVLAAIAEHLRNDPTIGVRVLLPSCNIRFEVTLFYNTTAVAAEAPSPPEGNGSRTWIIVGSILSAVVGVVVGITMWRRKKFRKEERLENSQVFQLPALGDDYSDDNDQGHAKSQDFPSIHLRILQEATNQFSNENKLGQGGFGPVYKGTLEDGKEIAVKRLSITSGQGLREFMNEVTLIAKLQHRNLVRLLGCCLEKNEKLLVYEYMPNKSLDFFLFDTDMALQLDWPMRLSIINGVTRGLLYLHEDSRLRVIHRDLKASNILLDYEMNPKISDFGMARIFARNESEANTNRIVGTFGYMAPEYAMSGLCSVKSDVFSFGVLLLEIISGRRNGRFHLSEEGESLLTFAWKLWSEGRALELMDPLLVKTSVASEVQKCVHIGLLCVQEDPADRPTMTSVVVMLVSDTITLPIPTQPAFSVGRAVVMEATSSSNQKVCSVNKVTLSSVSPR